MIAVLKMALYQGHFSRKHHLLALRADAFLDALGFEGTDCRFNGRYSLGLESVRSLFDVFGSGNKLAEISGDGSLLRTFLAALITERKELTRVIQSVWRSLTIV